MTLRLDCVVFDTNDPARIARFWEEALGWRITESNPTDVSLEAPEGSGMPAILFLRVPEAKTVKNRLHLDLRPDDQDAEVARLEALGARRVSVGQGPEATWVVLADPDGNEFCVLRSL
jgi:predicted enzyme related to lactoylglutathione lyase